MWNCEVKNAQDEVLLHTDVMISIEFNRLSQDPEELVHISRSTGEALGSLALGNWMSQVMRFNSDGFSIEGRSVEVEDGRVTNYRDRESWRFIVAQ